MQLFLETIAGPYLGKRIVLRAILGKTAELARIDALNRVDALGLRRLRLRGRFYGTWHHGLPAIARRDYLGL